MAELLKPGTIVEIHDTVSNTIHVGRIDSSELIVWEGDKKTYTKYMATYNQPLSNGHARFWFLDSPTVKIKILGMKKKRLIDMGTHYKMDF